MVFGRGSMVILVVVCFRRVYGWRRVEGSDTLYNFEKSE